MLFTTTDLWVVLIRNRRSEPWSLDRVGGSIVAYMLRKDAVNRAAEIRRNEPLTFVRIQRWLPA